MADFWAALTLTPSQGIALAAICFAAGLVRGFTGFALSAFGLALAVLILPPVELIPVMWWLELAASLVMLRHGWGGADVRAAVTLVLGSVLGLFGGLALTTSVDPAISQQIALVVLIALALLQLTGLRIPQLSTKSGTLITGLIAGVVTGLAGIGGMVVALYVLARNDEPAKMRATLVAFLFIGSFTSFGMHLWFGTMNTTSTLRGLAFILPCVIGVLIGQRLFTPRLQPYYRPTCLTLLIGLGAVSLVRSVL
ncbi:TSUP family transporter [Pseudosulfitobacter sp. SM2401]|uniref:TSUP family transporter n=1 Tax=Pseudosulfitobacter sp. SM2401 TaxID=3350098 RepID=UPI0036F2DA9A